MSIDPITPPEDRSFWTSLPGVLAQLAALIVAITGLIAVITHCHSDFGDCPQIRGQYYEKTQDETLSLDQSDCNITGVSNTRSHRHQLSGRWDSTNKRFDYRVLRIENQNNKVATMYGYLTVSDQNHIHTFIYRTDGGDNMRLDFSEALDWQKQ